MHDIKVTSPFEAALAKALQKENDNLEKRANEKAQALENEIKDLPIPAKEVTQIVDENRKEWIPTKKQERFIQLPFDVFEAGYGGALGSGKTDLLMLLPLLYGFHNHRKYRGVFFRRTYPELESEVIVRSKEFFPSTGAIYNEQRHRWEFRRGGYDAFRHLEHEKDVKKYDTSQFNLTRWDEATSFTPFQYEYISLRRTRSGTPDLPAIVRWGSNPGNVGHVYFRKRFVDPYRAGNKILRDPKTGLLRFFLPATAEDNKHLEEANPGYYKQRLASISSEAERRAMILGDWYTFEGQVFEEFRIEPLPGEPENARHVIDPFKIPDWWPRLIGIDWGFHAKCFVIWAAISPEGRVFIYRTYSVTKTKIRQWTRDISLLSAGEMEAVRDIRICFSAEQDRGHDQTIEQQVAEALGEAGFTCGLTKGDRARVAGKQLIHEYLRWRPLPSIKKILGDYNPEVAQRLLRQGGNSLLEEYVNQFIDEQPEMNLPKMLIFNKSPEGTSNDELIEVIPSCVYNTDEKKGRMEDVKEFNGDDAYDCLRILLFAVRDYFGEAKDEFTQRTRYGTAVSRLQQTGDQTAYYRQCELIEASNQEVTSVRRGRFRRR